MLCKPQRPIVLFSTDHCPYATRPETQQMSRLLAFAYIWNSMIKGIFDCVGIIYSCLLEERLVFLLCFDECFLEEIGIYRRNQYAYRVVH